LLIGDKVTADRCTLNEAFNYIHSGFFAMARTKILQVRVSAIKRKDKSTLSMVQTATVFLRRVKRVVRTERNGNSRPCDNFQRIQVVNSRSRYRRWT